MSKMMCVWAGVVLVGIAASSVANDRNFEAAAAKQGCKSIVTTSGVELCRKKQKAMHDTCDVESTCDLHGQRKLAKAYKELLEWWEKEGKSGPENDFKRDKQRKMRQLVAELEAGREAARPGVTIANECIAARNGMQEWFQRKVIPLTALARDNLLAKRKKLLDTLEKRKRELSAARSKRDKARADVQLGRAFEEAKRAVAAAERERVEFDKRHGSNIARDAQTLIERYEAGRESHLVPTAQAEGRLENCQGTIDVVWAALPFP